MKWFFWVYSPFEQQLLGQWLENRKRKHSQKFRLYQFLVVLNQAFYLCPYNMLGKILSSWDNALLKIVLCAANALFSSRSKKEIVSVGDRKIVIKSSISTLLQKSLIKTYPTINFRLFSLAFFWGLRRASA